MAIVYIGRVGSAVGAAGTPNPAVITVGAGGVGAGHSIIVSIHMSNGATAPTIADTTGTNVYNLDVGPVKDPPASGLDSVTVRSAHNVAALVNGNTITVTMPANSEYFITVEEFSGLTGVLDGTNSNGATTGTAADSGVVNTTNANDLAYAACGVESTSATITWAAAWTSGNGHDITPHLTSGTDGLANAYQILSATGSPDAQATLATGAWMIGLVVYKGAAAGAVTSARPVYLPRRLGPGAVGPTFFARFPPAAPGISPPPGGLLGIPAYLPRRLGPGAVGPPFFARFPVPAPGASAGPLGVWLPAATFPASRNRSSFFVVRGRQVKAVPNQETPIVEQRSPGVRREPPRLSRGARPFPVQPQIAVPAPVIGSRVDSQRGKITSAQRGRQWSVVPPPPTVVLIWVPRQVPGHRRVILPSRGRVFAPVPAQVTVPVLVFPNRVDSQRSKIAALYRGKRWDVIPPQVVVVSVWVPTFISPNSTFY